MLDLRKFKQTTFFFLIMIAILPDLCAQEGRIVSKTYLDDATGTPVVELKWIALPIIYPEGVNLYRKTKGESTWEKLNTVPLRFQSEVPAALLEKYPEIELFHEVAKEANNVSDESASGFLIVNLLGKIFTINEFANLLGLYYKDTNIVANVAYQYKVATIKNGSEETLAISAPVLAGSFQYATPVEDFTVEQVKKVIQLDWKVDSDRFFAYNIRYNIHDSLQNVLLNEEPLIPSMAEDSSGNYEYPSPKFYYPDMVEGYYYTFWVNGLDFFGDQSITSDSVTFLFNDVTPPSKPTDLKVEVDSMHVQLTWAPSPSPDLREHIIYRSYTSDGVYKPIFSTPSASVYEENLEVPGAYFYYVAAIDEAGNVSKSSIEVAEILDLIPPSQPQGLTIASDTGQLKLSWQANTEPDLAGYLIFRTVDEDHKEQYVLLNSEPLDTVAFLQELPKVVKNKFYYYIIAIDTSYNYSEPSAFATGQMPDVMPPVQPFIKQVSYKEENILIEWIENVDNDLMGYHIYRSDSVAALNYERVNATLINPLEAVFTDQSSQANQGYLYYLEAIDSAGNASKPSLPAYAYRLKRNDTSSLELKVSINHNKRKNTNIIRWQRADAEGLLGYVVFKGEPESPLKPLTGLVSELAFEDRVLDGETYLYQVKAFTTTNRTIISKKITWNRSKK
ncbi:MAG: fibronectin type III domain-containing protein [Bacteroidota bacterium]